MGFSLTGTHVIFFIAAVIVAGMVSGVFIAEIMNVTTSLSNRGDRLKEQLDTDFAIINDPNKIPKQGEYYIFYLQNIGGVRLTTTNQTFQVFIDGEIIGAENYYFSNASIPQEGVTNLYVNTTIAAGDHTLRVVGPQAVDEEFTFTE
jgi:archaeal flagellar protein FlaG